MRERGDEEGRGIFGGGYAAAAGSFGGGKHPASLPPCPPLPSVRKRAGTAQKVQLLVATLMVKLLEVGWGLEVEN